MNHKVGDTVRIQPQDWIDAQEKLVGGSIEAGRLPFIPEMWKLAGRIARVTEAESNCYKIDLDSGFHNWTEEMFDPDYDPLAPLSAEDAIRAMLNGDVLQKIGYKVEEKWDGKHFVYLVLGEEKWTNKPQGGEFEGLGRKRKVRPMSRWEILAWANSEESRGWVVRYMDHRWQVPQISYGDNLEMYERARLLPDLSGIDESTIQGFEVEE
jgi:hypothetical protein